MGGGVRGDGMCARLSLFWGELPTHWQPQPTWEESLSEIMTGENTRFTSRQAELVRQLLRKYVQ